MTIHRGILHSAIWVIDQLFLVEPLLLPLEPELLLLLELEPLPDPLLLELALVPPDLPELDDPELLFPLLPLLLRFSMSMCIRRSDRSRTDLMPILLLYGDRTSDV